MHPAYELGLAHALGKPTVLVAPVDMPLFFDIGQERMVTYDKNNAFWGVNLGEDLTRAIEETTRNPSTAIPTAFMHIKPSRIESDEVIIRLRRIEDKLANIARLDPTGRPLMQSRFQKILHSLPDAEVKAERLLKTMNQEEACLRLKEDGFPLMMAETAVARAWERVSHAE